MTNTWTMAKFLEDYSKRFETQISDLKSENQKLKDQIDNLIFWVDGALHCKEWNWDAAQWDAAKWTVDEAKKLIQKEELK